MEPKKELRYYSMERILRKYCYETRADIGKLDDYHKISDTRFDVDYLLAPALTEEKQDEYLYIPNISDIDGGKKIAHSPSIYACYRKDPNQDPQKKHRPIKSVILDCFLGDVIDNFAGIFSEHIVYSLSDEFSAQLINEITDIIQYEQQHKTILMQRANRFLSLACKETLSEFLAEVYVFAVKRDHPNFNEYDDSEFSGLKHLRNKSVLGAKPARSGIYNEPYCLNDAFYNIDEALEKLQKSFRDSSHVIISGEPGIGKTEVALRFANLIATDRRNTVIWLDAENDTKIEKSIRQFLLEKNISPDAENQDLFTNYAIQKTFKEWLSGNKKWWLIIDGIKDADNKANLTYQKYLPTKLENGKILLTTNKISQVSSYIIRLEQNYNFDLSVDYLYDRYGDIHKVGPWILDSHFTFKDLPFVLEMMSGYALEKEDFGFSFLSQPNSGFFQEETPLPDYDPLIGMIVWIHSNDSIKKQINNMNTTELIYGAFNVVWNTIDQKYKFLLQLAANMPTGELDAETLEELFYSETDYDFYRNMIPTSIWQYITNPNLFITSIKRLMRLGICKVSFYVKNDTRWNEHFNGLKKIRLHNLIREFILMDTDHSIISNDDFSKLVAKLNQ